MFDSLPNNNFLDSVKFQAFADDNLSVAKIMVSIFDRVENIVGKGENAGNQHFLLFSTMFYTLSRRKIITLAKPNLSSANASVW